MNRKISAMIAATVMSLGFSMTAYTAEDEELAQLRVNVDPERATVTCDGKEIGIAPVTIGGLAEGDHLITATISGHNESRRTVSMSAGQRKTIDLKLEPIHGLVLIHTTPDGAEVEIDSASRGKTPLLVTDLTIGEYRVVLTSPGFVPKEVKLRVDDRTPIKLNVELVSDSATIVLDSIPSGARVMLNGLDQEPTGPTAPPVPGGAYDGSGRYCRDMSKLFD